MTYKEKYPTLFFDEYQLLEKGAEELGSVISARIKQHEAEEETRRLKIEKKNDTEKVEPEQLHPKQISISYPAKAETPSKEPKKEAGGKEEPVTDYVMTVFFRCSRNKAVYVGKTVDRALKAFGDIVQAVNIDKAEK